MITREGGQRNVPPVSLSSDTMEIPREIIEGVPHMKIVPSPMSCLASLRASSTVIALLECSTYTKHSHTFIMNILPEACKSSPQGSLGLPKPDRGS